MIVLSEEQMIQALKEGKTFYYVDEDDYHDYADGVVFYQVLEEEVCCIGLDDAGNLELQFAIDHDFEWFATKEEAEAKMKELSAEVISDIGCNATREELQRQMKYLEEHGSYDGYVMEVKSCQRN